MALRHLPSVHTAIQPDDSKGFGDMQTSDKLSYGIKDACEATGLGRSFLYQRIADGELPIFKIGARTLIAANDLEEFLQRHRQQS